MLSSPSRPADRKNQKVRIIGVSGPSGSGKSTLANQLAVDLNSPYIPLSMDFFFNKNRIYEELKGNWECPEALDADFFVSQIRELKHELQQGKLREALTTPSYGKYALLPKPDSEQAMMIMQHDAQEDKKNTAEKQKEHEEGPLGEKKAVYIVVEGFLLFCFPSLVNLCNFHFFIMCSKEECCRRRYERNRLGKKQPFEEFQQWFSTNVWKGFETYFSQQVGLVPFAHIVSSEHLTPLQIKQKVLSIVSPPPLHGAGGTTSQKSLNQMMIQTSSSFSPSLTDFDVVGKAKDIYEVLCNCELGLLLKKQQSTTCNDKATKQGAAKDHFPCLRAAIKYYEQDTGISFQTEIFPFLKKCFEQFNLFFPIGQVPFLNWETTSSSCSTTDNDGKRKKSDGPAVDLSGSCSTLSFSREEILSILTAAFFCQFSSPNKGGGEDEGVNLPRNNTFFSMFTADESQKHVVAKLRMYLQYFHVMRERSLSQTSSSRCTTKKGIESTPLIFSRVCRHYSIKDKEDEDDDEGKLSSWVPVQFRKVFESIDDEVFHSDATRVDFANRFLGGGAWRGGAVQEEIMFARFPELSAGIVFSPKMEADEAIVIQGAQMFSKCKGYAKSLQFDGPTARQGGENNDFAATSCVCAIDAEEYKQPHKLFDQFDGRKIHRDISKALAGFSFSGEGTDRKVSGTIATGNWGCGDFKCDIDLKFLQQWIACSLAKKTAMMYFPFDPPTTVYLTQVCKNDLSSMEKDCTPKALTRFLTSSSSSSFQKGLELPNHNGPSVIEQCREFVEFYGAVKRQLDQCIRIQDDESHPKKKTGEKKKEVYALVHSGAYNPIHRGHFYAIRQAEAALPSGSVLGSFVFPSSESYVASKKGMESYAMKTKIRCDIIREAIRDEERENAGKSAPVFALPWNIANHTQICSRLVSTLQEFFPSLLGEEEGNSRFRLVVLPVFGSDFPIRCQYFQNMICIHRDDGEKSGEKIKQLVDHQQTGGDFVYVPPPVVPMSKEVAQASSTLIRNLLKNPNTKMAELCLYMHPSCVQRMIALNERMFLQSQPVMGIDNVTKRKILEQRIHRNLILEQKNKKEEEQKTSSPSGEAKRRLLMEAAVVDDGGMRDPEFQWISCAVSRPQTVSTPPTGGLAPRPLVLIIDHDPDVVKSFQILTDKAGIQVEYFPNPQKCVEYCIFRKNQQQEDNNKFHVTALITSSFSQELQNARWMLKMLVHITYPDIVLLCSGKCWEMPHSFLDFFDGMSPSREGICYYLGKALGIAARKSGG